MKRRILTVIRLIISVGLIGYLLTLIDLAALYQRIKDLHWLHLGLGLTLLAGQSVFSALKWKAILAAEAHRPHFPAMLKIILIGNFFSLFLPTSFGGDAYRVYRMGRSDVGFARSAASVLFDRGSGLFALVSIGIVAYASLDQHPYLTTLVASYAGAIALFILMTSARAASWLNQNSWFARVTPVLRSMGMYRAHLPTLLLVLLLSFAFQFNTVVINKTYLMALGVDIPWSHLLIIVPVVYLTEILPISINGIGIRESAYAMLFSLYGYEIEDAIMLGFLVLSMRYLVGLIGGSLYLLEAAQRSVRMERAGSP